MQGLRKAHLAQRCHRACRYPHAITVFPQLFTNTRVLDNCKKFDLDKSGLKGKADDRECS